jgi:hypothetical protein
VLSESAARRLWPDGEAVGRAVAIPAVSRYDANFQRIPAFASARVIGVVKDVTSAYDGPEETCIYFPTGARAAHNESVLVRLAGAPFDARRHIVAALDSVAPSVPDLLVPMDDVKALLVYPFRVTSWVAGFLGGVALLLTVSGIYGVMSYLVTQRTKEIGIRVALGAGTAEVLGMVLGQAARLAAIGATVGVGLMLILAPLVAHEIGVIHAYDWIPYAATAAIVLFAAVAASYAPSMKAVRIDPAVTLRGD